MTQELNDLSGPFDPDLGFDGLSKEFLLKIMDVWQLAWVHMAQAFLEVTRERFGLDVANEIQLEAWLRIAERVNPRYAQIANIKLETVLDSLKALQLPLDNTMHNMYHAEYDIKNENHVIVSIRDCRTLCHYEKRDPDMIRPTCHVLEPKVIEKYMINPRIQVKALKLPPRESPDEISCQWEYTLADPP
jgi:hypothetical protein